MNFSELRDSLDWDAGEALKDAGNMLIAGFVGGYAAQYTGNPSMIEVTAFLVPTIVTLTLALMVVQQVPNLSQDSKRGDGE